jgi:hypothetical protein
MHFLLCTIHRCGFVACFLCELFNILLSQQLGPIFFSNIQENYVSLH